MKDHQPVIDLLTRNESLRHLIPDADGRYFYNPISFGYSLDRGAVYTLEFLLKDSGITYQHAMRLWLSNTKE